MIHHVDASVPHPERKLFLLHNGDHDTCPSRKALQQPQPKAEPLGFEGQVL